MWRRWNNQPNSGTPNFMDTDQEEQYLETIAEESRPTSVATALPDLPFRAVPPMKGNDPICRQSVSSVYSQNSQPSPTLPPDEVVDASAKSPNGPDISPVSTPRSSINLAASDTSLVSPINSTFDLPPRQPQSESQQNPQVPRSTHLPRPAQNTPSQKKNTTETKWDDYSGEPTTAETGKAAQVRPGAPQPLEMQYPQLKERTKQILAGLRDRGGGPQKNVWGRAPPPVAADPLDNPPIQKEPWKGGSGREAIVAPVKNTAAARTGPLKHAERNVSKMDPTQDRARAVSPEGDIRIARQRTQAAPVQVSQRTYTTQPKAKPSQRPDLSIKVLPMEEEVKPVAPLKIKSPRVTSSSEVANTDSLRSPFHSPHPSQPKVSSGATTSLQRIYLEPSQLARNVTSDDARQPVETDQQQDVSQMVHEPVSHLSWTTYATTANDSPDSLGPTHMDSSPVPPLPSMSSPLVMRKRPVTNAPNNLPFSNSEAAGSRASIISRKPVPPDSKRSASGMSSASKSLPPTPIEMQAGDKITTLEARLEDLGMRRRNNRKIVREMQENLKRNAIVYTMRKRLEVEKQIANMEQELTDIGREEHDVGLLLHRAQKKRDREACYENPTGLWIKRVTT